jgi:hypothetical protein
MRRVVPSPRIWRAEPDPGIRGLVRCQPGPLSVAPGSWGRVSDPLGRRDLSEGRGHEYSTRRLRSHLKFLISHLYKQPRPPIDLQKTLLSERGDESEEGKSGISIDNFSLRALHQVLDVGHHFRQMGITGKMVIGSWSRHVLSILNQKVTTRISHGRKIQYRTIVRVICGATGRLVGGRTSG